MLLERKTSEHREPLGEEHGQTAIQRAITGFAQITGDYTQQQAQAVFAVLKTGKLPISLQVIKNAPPSAS